MKRTDGKQAVRLSVIDFLLFGEACFWLMLASFLRLAVPFRWYAPLFGRIQEGEIPKPEGRKDEGIVAIAQAISRGSRHLPFACRCLVQALAAKAMLRIRKRKSVVFIGVAKDDKDELIAHAWVRCRKFYVCGAKEMGGHTIIAVFSD